MRHLATIRLNSDVEPLTGLNLIPNLFLPGSDQVNNNQSKRTIKNPRLGTDTNFLTSYSIADLANNVLGTITKAVPIDQQTVNEFVHCIAPIFGLRDKILTTHNKYISRQLLANWFYVARLTFFDLVKLVLLTPIRRSRHTQIFQKLTGTKQWSLLYLSNCLTQCWQKSAEKMVKIRQDSQKMLKSWPNLTQRIASSAVLNWPVFTIGHVNFGPFQLITTKTLFGSLICFGVNLIALFLSILADLGRGSVHKYAHVLRKEKICCS